MLPEYCISTVDHFRSLGAAEVVCGDTTVAYSGDRGYHENHGSCARYLSLADAHGWTERGPLGTPFVVLDRPQTSVKGKFRIAGEEVRKKTSLSKSFKEVFLSGGFESIGQTSA